MLNTTGLCKCCLFPAYRISYVARYALSNPTSNVQWIVSLDPLESTRQCSVHIQLGEQRHKMSKIQYGRTITDAMQNKIQIQMKIYEYTNTNTLENKASLDTECCFLVTSPWFPTLPPCRSSKQVDELVASALSVFLTMLIPGPSQELFNYLQTRTGWWKASLWNSSKKPFCEDSGTKSQLRSLLGYIFPGQPKPDSTDFRRWLRCMRHWRTRDLMWRNSIPPIPTYVLVARRSFNLISSLDGGRLKRLE